MKLLPYWFTALYCHYYFFLCLDIFVYLVIDTSLRNFWALNRWPATLYGAFTFINVTTLFPLQSLFFVHLHLRIGSWNTTYHRQIATRFVLIVPTLALLLMNRYFRGYIANVILRPTMLQITIDFLLFAIPYLLHFLSFIERNVHHLFRIPIDLGFHFHLWNHQLLLYLLDLLVDVLCVFLLTLAELLQLAFV